MAASVLGDGQHHSSRSARWLQEGAPPAAAHGPAARVERRAGCSVGQVGRPEHATRVQRDWSAVAAAEVAVEPWQKIANMTRESNVWQAQRPAALAPVGDGFALPQRLQCTTRESSGRAGPGWVWMDVGPIRACRARALAHLDSGCRGGQIPQSAQGCDGSTRGHTCTLASAQAYPSASQLKPEEPPLSLRKLAVTAA